MSTRSTAVPTAAVDNGQCIAHMATTHVSKVRAEMPSGMVPLRELEYRYRPLHPGGHTHIAGCIAHATLHTIHTTHASARCKVTTQKHNDSSSGPVDHTWPPLTAAR